VTEPGGKSGFKQAIESDVMSVFLNGDDFGEEHIIDGEPVCCILATDHSSPLGSAPNMSVSDADVELYASEADVKRGRAGEHITIDHAVYVIDTWQADMGVVHATLSRSVDI
jgi:hypothetical protein